jgi:hypothetical protein
MKSRKPKAERNPNDKPRMRQLPTIGHDWERTGAIVQGQAENSELCSARELGVGANPIPFCSCFHSFFVFLFFYSDLLGFTRIWSDLVGFSDCPYGMGARGEICGKRFCGPPGIAANVNLFRCFHFSFLISFCCLLYSTAVNCGRERAEFLVFRVMTLKWIAKGLEIGIWIV